MVADMATVMEESPLIIFSVDAQSPVPMGTEELTSEKEQAPSAPDEAETRGMAEPTLTPSPTPRPAASSAPSSFNPKSGTIAVIDGNRCMWVPGFGRVKEEEGGVQGTMVGSPGDELTGSNRAG